MNQRLPEPVRRYLAAFELALKARPVISVEDALSDCREHLVRDYAALLAAEPTITDEECVAHFEQTWGRADAAAEAYRIPGATDQVRGHAPGWRICCRSCGRSVPADRFPLVRLGAASSYKVTLTWCRGCSRFRLVRFLRDRDTPNLTEHLGLLDSADDVRRKLHWSGWPWLTAIIMLVIVLSVAVRLRDGRNLPKDPPAVAGSPSITP